MNATSPPLPPSARLARVIANFFGAGLFPIAAATFASAIVAGLYFLIPVDPVWQATLIALATVSGIWASDVYSKAAQIKDPHEVVMDEVAGMLIACWMLPHDPVAITAAFFLFRLFDIGKWPPMKQLEHLPGGWGIMCDDLAAGLIARLCLLPWF